MTAPTSFSGDLTRDLSELLTRGATPEEVQRHIFFFNLEKTEASDPALADCLRFCAIPRRFDADIIGILRDAPDDREENDRLLAALLAYSFVRPREDGGYVYHDNTRDMLLQDWRETDDKRSQFNKYCERLATYYEAAHKRSRQTEQDLARVAGLLRRANPDRYMQVAVTVERILLAPLVEALYYNTQQSAETGYSFFSLYYEGFEKTGRLTVCESLLKACRDFLEDLPADEARDGRLKWLRYWQARLVQRLRRDQEAETILNDLLPKTETDTKLKLWVLSELGATLHRQYRLREARQVYEQELDLARRTREDPFNLPTSHSRVAWLRWSLEELEPAAMKYRETIESARQENNLRVEIYSYLNLCGVLQGLGRWAEALAAILDAIHLVRTRAVEDVALHFGVASRLMYLVARRDPRLLDTAYDEAQALVTAMADPFQPLELRGQYADLLRQSGRLTRADEILTDLRASESGYADASFVSEILLYTALLREDQGKVDEAVQLYNTTLSQVQKGRGTAWHRAATLSNLGMLNTTLGNWTESETTLQAAIAQWHDIGHDQHAARMQVALANVKRLQGRMSEAQALMDKAGSVLGGINPSYLADYRQDQGHLHRDQGRWAAARECYQQALRCNRSLDQYRQTARNLVDLASLAANEGRWKEAAQRTAEAARLWRRLAAADRYRPSHAAIQADEDNARGLLLFSESSDDRREKVRQARDLFRSASDRIPQNPWYAINLAYACAELQEWADAAEAIEAVLSHGPEWFDSQFFYQRLGEYRLRQGDQLLAAGEYAAASALYRDLQTRLEARVPFEHLADCWLKLGDSYLRQNMSAEAKAAYEDGLNRATAANFPTLQAAFHTRLGFLSAVQHQLPAAVEHFRTRLSLATGESQNDLAGELARSCSELFGSLSEYRALAGALRALAGESSLEASLRRALNRARLKMARNSYIELLRPDEEPAQAESTPTLPVVTPIALEADARLFPEGEDNSAVDRLVNVVLPAMRERIRERTGVRVPGVRIRSNEGELGEGGYLLILHEVPIVFGTVQPSQKYCPDVDGCRQLGIEVEATANPGEDGEGMWLDETLWQRAEQAGLPLWDPYETMIFHLEAVIRQHLDTFVGLQEAQNLLELWSEGDTNRQALLGRAFGGSEDKVRFVQVLQALVKEGVPVVDLGTILTIFAEENPGSSEVTDIVEKVRFALRPHLPGNEGDRLLVGLSSEFEEVVRRGIGEQQGKRFLAIPPQETQELLSAVRSGLARQSGKRLALVLRDFALRPFVRRLTEIEFPLLPVLSQRELTSDGRTIQEQIAYSSPAINGN